MNNSWAPPVLPGGQPSSRPEQRQYFASRTVSTILVILVHIFLFFFFAISILREERNGRHSDLEMILLLQSKGNDKDNNLRLIEPDVQQQAPPAYSTAPLAIPKVQPPAEESSRPSATPGDILGAVGQSLACAAGNYEHLTQPERNICRREPWRGAKLPSGNIVMVPSNLLPRLADPPSEFRVTGADQVQHDVQTGGSPCPILQNTPCLHDVLHPTTDPGIP